MTIDQLKRYLLSIDPDLKEDYSSGDKAEYTVWSKHHPRTLMSDDMPEDVVYIVTIHRYTKADEDEIAERIYDDLTAASVPLTELQQDYNEKEGYLHSIIECYAAKGE